MPQLDSLRAIAIGAVFSVHFVGRAPSWYFSLPLASFGVELFFVLSGFLITGILLDARNSVSESGRLRVLGRFYIRRALRICPIYYLLISVGFLVGLPGFYESFPWNAAYVTNFYITLKQHWIEAASHLWTLSVEEQFYLLWPWVVLFSPQRILTGVFTGVVAVSICYRAMAYQFLGEWLNITPLASFNCFGVGALLSLAHMQEAGGVPRLRRLLSWSGLAIGVPLFVLVVAYGNNPGALLRRDQWIDVPVTFLFLPLISGAARGYTGLLGKILLQPVLRYLGRISYGLYLFHLPVAWLAGHSEWIKEIPRFIPQSLVLFSITLGLAVVSWHLFEQPLNNMKRLFPYRLKRINGSVARA